MSGNQRTHSTQTTESSTSLNNGTAGALQQSSQEHDPDIMRSELKGGGPRFAGPRLFRKASDLSSAAGEGAAGRSKTITRSDIIAHKISRQKLVAHSLKIQTRLKVGRADDRFEKEADSVAEQVENNRPLIQRRVKSRSQEVLLHRRRPFLGIDGASAPRGPRVEATQRREDEELDQKPMISRLEDEPEAAQARLIQRRVNRGGGFASGNVEKRIQNSRGGGQAMDSSTRSYMEEGVGADFSNVRIHTGPEAGSLSKSLNAQAFTVGRDVFFGEGRYSPHTPSGRNLLAHELTHTVQQGAAVQRRPVLGRISRDTSQRVQRGYLDYVPGASYVASGLKYVGGKVAAGARYIGGKVVQGLKALGNIITKYANDIPGFRLFSVIIKKNPITGRPVPRTFANLLHGVLTLYPPLGYIYKRIKKAGVIGEAGRWLTKNIKRLGITWPRLKYMVKRAKDKIWKNPGKVRNILVNTFTPLFRRALRFAWSAARYFGKLILKGLLKLAGPFGVKVFKIINKGKHTISQITKNPIRFIFNFFRAVKLGFLRFKKNFVKHFKKSLFEWLFGQIGGAGITLPAKFNLAGIFSIVMQVLGLTYANIRARVVFRLGKRIGKEKAEKAVGYAEKGFAIVRTLITKGPIGIWELVKAKLGNLKEMIMGPVIGFVRNRIIIAGVETLLGILIPWAGLLKAAISLYRGIVFFIENRQRIMDTVLGVLNSIAAIASGKLGSAAKFIEKNMARGLTLLISFLARFLGLGGISKTLTNIMGKIRKPVNKALDFVIKKIIKFGMGALRKIKGGIKAIFAWWKLKRKFKKKDGSRHTLFFNKKQKGNRLMMASEVTDVRTFLTIASKQHSEIASQQKIIRDARGFTDTIEELTKKIDKNTQKSKKAGTNPSQIANTNKKDFKTLTEATNDLGKTMEGINTVSDTKRPATVWPPFVNGVKAMGFEARFITKRGSKMPQGEAAAGKKTPTLLGWQELYNERLTTASKWVRMHLLSEHLGGKVKDSNLTPARGQDNKDFLHKVETPAWNAVGEGKMIWFKVELKYHTNEFKNYISNIRATWGIYTEKNKKWKAGPAMKKDFKSSPKVPELSFSVNLNSNRTTSLQIQKLPLILKPLSDMIVEERSKGKFSSQENFFERINLQIDTLKGSSGEQTKKLRKRQRTQLRIVGKMMGPTSLTASGTKVKRT